MPRLQRNFRSLFDTKNIMPILENLNQKVLTSTFKEKKRPVVYIIQGETLNYVTVAIFRAGSTIHAILTI